jgi:chromosome segregation ATPase
MDDSLRERVEALERTVADGEFDGGDTDGLDERLSALESRLDTVESQLDDVEAATQALRGYVGNVRSVNEEVEQRADTAIAKVRALEDELDESRQATRDATPQPTEPGQRATQTNRSSVAQQRNTGPETGERRCHSCGQVHTAEQAETDGGPSRSPSETEEEPLVPEQTDDTGRLRRIRELL